MCYKVLGTLQVNDKPIFLTIALQSTPHHRLSAEPPLKGKPLIMHYSSLLLEEKVLSKAKRMRWKGLCQQPEYTNHIG